MSKKGKPIEPPQFYGALLVNYAPTGRAACKKCSGIIPQDSVRVGRKVRSRFHDGYDTQFYHWRCGKDYGTSLDEFAGWMSLDWSEVDSMLSDMNESFVSDTASVKFYRSRAKWVSDAARQIEECGAASLRKTMIANQLAFHDKANAEELAGVVADQILFGKLPQCPVCKNYGLRQTGTDIKCHGYYSVSTKCEFKFRFLNLIEGRPEEKFWDSPIQIGDAHTASQLSRAGELVLPDEVRDSKAYRALKIPDEVQEMRKKNIKRAVKRAADPIESSDPSSKQMKVRSPPTPGSPLLSVDAECDVNYGRIYVDRVNNAYNVMLTKVDTTHNINKFYAIQLVAYGISEEIANNNPMYAVFKKWGRMGGQPAGGRINSCTTEKCERNLDYALQEFHKKFNECTGQDFIYRDSDKQIPGRYAIVEIGGQTVQSKGGASPKSSKSGASDASRVSANASQVSSTASGSQSPRSKDSVQSGSPSSGSPRSSHKQIKSQLPEVIQSLIAMVFDIAAMERQMSKQLNIDIAQLSPEALSNKQLDRGMVILKEVAQIISAFSRMTSSEKDGEGHAEGSLQADAGPDSADQDDLEPIPENLKNKSVSELSLMIRDASNRFYTVIPHTLRKNESLPLIDNLEELKKKLTTLDDLSGIVELQRIRQFAQERSEATNLPAKSLIDIQYEQLACQIQDVPATSSQFLAISKALRETHGASHDQYSMSIVHVYQVSRQGEYERFAADPCQTNKKMLWHGSRITNWAKILKHGLRVAPKEAPVTGYMFGKGIYFADCSSKAANYCFPTHTQTDGLLVLCEVSCGKPYYRLQNELRAPGKCKKRGCDSTEGVGKSAPTQTVTPFKAHGIDSPMYTGKLSSNEAMQNKLAKESPAEAKELLYNEYVVYRESQVCMRYIVHVRFTLNS